MSCDMTMYSFGIDPIDIDTNKTGIDILGTLYRLLFVQTDYDQV